MNLNSFLFTELNKLKLRRFEEIISSNPKANRDKLFFYFINYSSLI